MEQDGISFQELYKRHSADVYRFSYWLCGNADDAQDITSETFIRIWTSTTEVRTGTIKAYLFTIARNLYLHQRRIISRFAPIPESIAETAHGFDDNIEARESLDHAMAAIGTLREIDRTVLLLRAQEELSYEEIAAITGLSVSAIKVKVFRARKKLHQLLSHQ